MAPKAILPLACAWAVCFVLLLALDVPAAALVRAADIFEIAFGLLCGSILLAASTRQAETTPRHVLLGTALALFSWTLGQVFWFSYTELTGVTLPYPSVGDLGYTGTYFFLAGVLRLLLGQRKAWHPWYSWFSLLALAVPVAVVFAGGGNTAGILYNFVLALAAGYAYFLNCALIPLRRYRWYAGGVFLLGIADLVFMLSVCLYPASHLYLPDLLYSLSLALLAHGAFRGADANG